MERLVFQKNNFFINDSKLEIVNKYKSLGLNFYSSGLFHNRAGDIMNGPISKLRPSWPLLILAKIPSFTIMFHYFDSEILPTTLYTSHISALTNFNAIVTPPSGR